MENNKPVYFDDLKKIKSFLFFFCGSCGLFFEQGFVARCQAIQSFKLSKFITLSLGSSWCGSSNGTALRVRTGVCSWKSRLGRSYE